MSGSGTVAPAVLPAPRAIVPADQVEAAIVAAQHELDALDAELARLVAEAQALEATTGDHPDDPYSRQFVAVRFQRFLDGLRAEANAELDALMAMADARRTRGAVLSWDAFFARRAVAKQAVATAPVVSAEPVVAPVVPDASAAAAPPPLDVPAAEPAPVPAPVPAAPVMPVPMGLPRVPEALPADGPVAPVVDLDPSSPEQVLEDEFWSDEPSSGWHHARRTLRTVGWQAAAVLLLVAAVLVRVG